MSMMDFDEAITAADTKNSPLAARMRPRTLDEFIGQEHIIGPGRLLRRAIQADQLTSILLYGPPGTGKTTLAQIIANTTKARFLAINAVLAGVKDIRDSIAIAQQARREQNQKTILFVDEVHRFNKSQQDALLPHVENGTLTLIGATTENPYFEVIKALVSRSRIFQLRALEEEDVKAVALAALADPERGYGRLRVEIEPEALQHIVRVASGDARSALNALELAVETTQAGAGGVTQITLAVAEESIQRRSVLYDKDGDAHYDTISAFIKSLRGSDADASLYWLSKMVYAGEDPRFIFRRMLILASEDVGMADPQALGVVSAAAAAYDYVGLPEGQFHLAQACLYLASAPKSNTTMAYYDALEAVRREQKDEVPDHLKDPSRDGADMGHGKAYLYPHAYRDHWVAQQYLPSSLQGKIFYQPTDSGYEAGIRERVARNREAQMEVAAQALPGMDGEWGGGVVAKSASLSNKPNRGAGKLNTWLDRAAGQSGEILKQVRAEIFLHAKIKRDSLALDLSGGTGFLTWEACRLCTTGGVWSRCNDEGERNAMEEWIRHLETLARPELVTASLNELIVHLRTRPEPPRFDGVVALGILSKVTQPVELITQLQTFSNKNSRLVWSEMNPTRSQGFLELFPSGSIPKELSEKVALLEKSWRGTLESSPLDSLQAAINLPKMSAFILNRDFVAKKHFTPTQIQHWFFAETTTRPTSLLAKLVGALTLNERAQLVAALVSIFGGSGSHWRHSYDFLVVEFT